MVSELEYAELVLDGVLSGRVIKIYEESDSIAGMLCLDKDRVEWVSGDSIGADTVAGMQFIGRAFKAVWRLIVRAVMAVVNGLKRLWEWLTGGKGSTNPDTPGSVYEEKPTPVGGVIGKEMAKEDKANVETALAVAELDEKGVDIEKAAEEAARQDAAKVERRKAEAAEEARRRKDGARAARDKQEAESKRINDERMAREEEEAKIALKRHRKEALAAELKRKEELLQRARKLDGLSFTIEIPDTMRVFKQSDIASIERDAIITENRVDYETMRSYLAKSTEAIIAMGDAGLKYLTLGVASLYRAYPQDGEFTDKTRDSINSAISNVTDGYVKHAANTLRVLLHGHEKTYRTSLVVGERMTGNMGGGDAYLVTVSATPVDGQLSVTSSLVPAKTRPALKYVMFNGTELSNKNMVDSHYETRVYVRDLNQASEAQAEALADAIREFNGYVKKLDGKPGAEVITDVIKNVISLGTVGGTAIGNVVKRLSKYQAATANEAVFRKDLFINILDNEPMPK